MFERIIWIIDDDPKVEETLIENYKVRIENIKKSFVQWQNCDFKLFYLPSLSLAKQHLEENSLVDVLVVDYDFNGEVAFKNGSEFVTYVREKINKQCRIIFYTMQGIKIVENEELVSLINSDVYLMIDKSLGNDIMAKAIFEAAISCSPVVLSLERFFYQYRNILNKTKYNVFDREFALDEIINHIRMDDEIGRAFIDKLLYKAIIKETELKE